MLNNSLNLSDQIYWGKKHNLMEMLIILRIKWDSAYDGLQNVYHIGNV